jgi:hypothetical protein
LFAWSGAVATARCQTDKSLFASFSSEKEEPLDRPSPQVHNTL